MDNGCKPAVQRMACPATLLAKFRQEISFELKALLLKKLIVSSKPGYSLSRICESRGGGLTKNARVGGVCRLGIIILDFGCIMAKSVPLIWPICAFKLFLMVF